MKYSLIILFTFNLINSAEIPLKPIQKLSLLDSIRKGTLEVHETYYKCSSFVTKKSYFINPRAANQYLKKFLNTRTTNENRNKGFGNPIVQKHPKVLTHEDYSPEVQEEYLANWTQELKNSITASELSLCMCAIIDNSIQQREKYLEFFKIHYDAVYSPAKEIGA